MHIPVRGAGGELGGGGAGFGLVNCHVPVAQLVEQLDEAAKE